MHLFMYLGLALIVVGIVGGVISLIEKRQKEFGALFCVISSGALIGTGLVLIIDHVINVFF